MFCEGLAITFFFINICTQPSFFYSIYILMFVYAPVTLCHVFSIYYCNLDSAPAAPHPFQSILEYIASIMNIAFNWTQPTHIFLANVNLKYQLEQEKDIYSSIQIEQKVFFLMIIPLVNCRSSFGPEKNSVHRTL